jgi:hypothetical protein
MSRGVSTSDLTIGVVSAVILAILVGIWIRWADSIMDWWVVRSGRLLTIERRSPRLQRRALGEDVVVRFRVRNRSPHAVTAQISYGDDPKFLNANFPEYLSCLTVLNPATFVVDGTPTQGGFGVPPHDFKGVEMRLAPKIPGRTALFASVIALGYDMRWTDAKPYLIDVHP